MLLQRIVIPRLDPTQGELVIYKGVEYIVTTTGEPDLWHWRFRIGGIATTGKTRTRLIHMATRRVQMRATRRVQMRIDAALKIARTAEQRRDGES